MSKCAIILAGGKGTRMKTSLPKVMCEVLFEPMIIHVIRAVKKAGCENVCVVTGHCRELVENVLPSGVESAFQSERLGTGHAVMSARSFVEKHKGDDILILNGDGPLMDDATINAAYDYHKKNENSITLISAIVDDTDGIGHIKRDENGKLLRIVEHKDANEEEKNINESNSGCYWFNGEGLLYALDNITNNNVQHEYYLTDSLEILLSKGENAGAFVVSDSSVTLGANDRKQLRDLNNIMRENIISRLLVSGVDIPCSDGVMIGAEVEIEADTRILPGTIITGRVKIGSGCVIGPNTQIKNSVIGNNVVLNNAYVIDSEIEDGADAGPFVQIRANSKIGKNVHLGDFVEVKNSVIDEKTKCAHLTYIGDSDVGKGVNFGCGTVTVNYDGKNKHRCKIGDNAFLGCNTNLIAPVEVGNNAFTAAGSTITDYVPENALAIARSRQTNKKDWTKNK